MHFFIYDGKDRKTCFCIKIHNNFLFVLLEPISCVETNTILALAPVLKVVCTKVCHGKTKQTWNQTWAINLLKRDTLWWTFRKCNTFCAVVSIDLFLVFFMPFSNNGVYLRQAKFLHYPSPSPTFKVAKLFLYLPKNDFVRKKRRERVKFVAPSQRNATFILHCTVFG